MFDFNRLRERVYEHYFKLFRSYDNQEIADYFIKRWLELLQSYTNSKDFLSFDPCVLNRLVPRAKAVILVLFPYIKVPYHSPFVSIFPYYPFRVKQTMHDITCYTGLEFFHLYLELTGIRTVCLYKIHSLQKNAIFVELQEKYPDIEIYENESFECFKRKVSRIISSSSKFQPRSQVLKDKVLQKEVL